MATVFVMRDGDVQRHEAPLRLGADGRVATARDGWAASIVSFAPGPRAPTRWAVVATPGIAVAVGACGVVAGVRPLEDGDHVFIGEKVEAIFSADAHPIAVADPAPDAACAVCCERSAPGGERRLFDCPKCPARACAGCWAQFPRGRCATPGCDQAAAFDRPLFVAEPRHFVTWEGPER